MTSSFPSDETILELFDENGEIKSVFFAETLGVHPDIALMLITSLRTETLQLKFNSAMQVWRHCLIFCRFLRSVNLADSSALPTDVLFQYRAWLERSDYSGKSRRTLFGEAKRLLRAAPPGCLAIPSNIKLSVLYKPLCEQPFRRLLNQDELRQITELCMRAAKECEERVFSGRLSLSCDAPTSRGTLLRELVECNDGRIPRQADLSKFGKTLPRRVLKNGGLLKLSSLVYPNTFDVFIFYLAMLIQTSGNPEAIRTLQLGCIKPHPLRSDVEWLVWDKPRSHREQKIESIVARDNSAANLAKRLLILNEPLRKLAATCYNKSVFLASCKAGPTVPSVQLLHNHLANFIAQNHLPNFDFRDIRASSAEIIYGVTHDIREVRIRLNHGDTRTTARYLAGRPVLEANDQLIHRFQGKLVAMARDIEESKDNFQERALRAAPDSFESTLFGFLCRDPFAGIAPGSSSGELCPSFSKCATCPGALIPLDDPKVVARLVASREALRRLKAVAAVGGWEDRFEAIYLPTLDVIENDILNSVAPGVLSIATEVAASIRLPTLE